MPPSRPHLSPTNTGISRQCIRRKKRRHRQSGQRAESSGEFLVEWLAAFPAECLANAE